MKKEESKSKQASQPSAKNGAEDGKQKRGSVYYAWASAALGVLLLVVWAWFVMSNGFQRWLAPMDLGGTAAEKPAAMAEQTPAEAAVLPSSDLSRDAASGARQPQTPADGTSEEVWLGRNKREGVAAARLSVQKSERLAAILQNQKHALKEMELQIERTQERLAGLDAAVQAAAQWPDGYASHLLSAVLNQADSLARAGQLDAARQRFRQAKTLLESLDQADEDGKKQMADAITADLRSTSKKHAAGWRSMRKEIDALLAQLIVEPAAAKSGQGDAQPSAASDSGYYQKTLLWLRDRLNRMIVVRHRHFPQLQAEDRTAVVYSLLLARAALNQQEASMYRLAVDNASAICRRAGADAMLAQLQTLAELELPPLYSGAALRLSESIKQTGITK